MPAGAAIGSAVIGGGSSLLSSGKAAGASKAATEAQLQAAREANELQKYMYDTTRADQEPWRNAGVSGLDMIMRGIGGGGQAQDGAGYVNQNPDVLEAWNQPGIKEAWGNDINAYGLAHIKSSGQSEGRAIPKTGPDIPDFLATFDESRFDKFYKPFDEEQFRADPGYQFRLKEGLRGVDMSKAASGLRHSGGTLKALNDYAGGMADQTYDKAYGRWVDEYGRTQDSYNRFNNNGTTIFNRLSSLAGIGQTANNQIAAAGQNYANQAGQNMIGAGNAAAQGAYGRAAAQNYGIQGLANAGQNILGQFGGGGSSFNAGNFLSGGGFNNASTGYGGAGTDISSLEGLF
jgi:hypothetical protein